MEQWRRPVTCPVRYDGLTHILDFLMLDMTHPENVPTAVFIYDFPSPQQEFVPRLRSVLLHSSPVFNARWNPVRKGSLVVCCNTQSVYTWSDEWVNESGEEEEMAECIGVPTREFTDTIFVAL